MASERRQIAPRGRAVRIPLLALAAAALLALAFAAPASADVVYDDAPVAGVEIPSFGFAETDTAELGTLVRFAGVARSDPRVSIPVESSADAPFSAPVTVSFYAPAADKAVGELLARQTESFEIDAAEPGFRSIGISFPGLTLPDEAIVSVAFEGDSLALAVAGPPDTGANPLEAEGIYRAEIAEGAAGPFEFEPFSALGQTVQPALAVEAFTATPVAAPIPTTTAANPPALRTFHREYSVPPSKRMTVSFPRPIARIAGPGALVQVRCTGSSAARCIGTLSLEAAGTVHKAPFSISKGRRQYVVVPLGDDLERLDSLEAPRATATASTVQLGGAAVKTKRALRLK
jgi:hypothetical protein